MIKNFVFDKNKYKTFENLMGWLHADALPDRSIVNPEQFEKEYVKQLELKIIDEFIRTFDQEFIAETIREAREILTIDNFPAEWIGETTNRFAFDNRKKSTTEDYREWLKWIVDALEQEAKIAGKLL